MQRLNRPEIILALDVDTLEEAEDFVDKLYPKIKIFKVGSYLFTAYGPKIIEMLHKKRPYSYQADDAIWPLENLF